MAGRRPSGGRPRPSARQRNYTTKWDKARAEYLKQNPWCVYCAQQGKQVKATTVDHETPHRGDWSIFWNRRDWQGLCTTHHSATKQREEKRGHAIGCDENGLPLDAGHHWNRG